MLKHMFCNHFVFALKANFTVKCLYVGKYYTECGVEFICRTIVYLFLCFNVLTFGFLFRTASYARKHHFSSNASIPGSLSVLWN